MLEEENLEILVGGSFVETCLVDGVPGVLGHVETADWELELSGGAGARTAIEEWAVGGTEV